MNQKTQACQLSKKTTLSSIQTVFSFGFGFFYGGCVLADRSPPSSRVASISASIPAVFITPKGAESLGSGRIGVIGALVFFPCVGFFSIRGRLG